MLKKYVTKLPDGRKTQYAALLGRQILLTDGNIVNESLLTQIYSSYFKYVLINTSLISFAKIFLYTYINCPSYLILIFLII